MMKRILFAAISLCLAAGMSAAAFTASAEASASAYPDVYNKPLAFESLTDYAVADQNHAAFAETDKITVLDGGETEVYNISGVTAVDYAVDESGAGQYYYSVAGKDEVYLLPKTSGGEPTVADYAMQEEKPPFYAFGDYYYTIEDGTGALLVFQAKDNPPVSIKDGTYSKIKIYGDNLYVLKSGALEDTTYCEICRIDGQNVTAISFNYSNYSLLNSVPTGDVFTQLAAYSEAPAITTIPAGTQRTEIDLNGLKPGDKTYNIADAESCTKVAESEEQALLLASSQGVAVVAVGAKAYILNENKLQGKIVLPLSDPEGALATVNAPDWAYSSPYACTATRAFEITAGEKLELINKVSAEGALAHDFYMVKKTVDGEEKTAYVPAEFLEVVTGGGDFNEGEPSVIPDPAPDNTDNVRIVTLVLIVVLLALIAAGYLTWVATRKKPESDDGKKTKK